MGRSNLKKVWCNKKTLLVRVGLSEKLELIFLDIRLKKKKIDAIFDGSFLSNLVAFLNEQHRK